MLQPKPPASLPKYLAESLPKQDTDALHDISVYVDSLIESRERPVETDELPDTAEPYNQAERAN